MFVRQLAQAVSDAITALEIRESGQPIAEDLEETAALPLEWYRQHANWPSGLAGHYTPLELSLVIARDGRVGVRYSVDVADHRLGPGDNWARILDNAAYLTRNLGIEQAELWALLTAHLDGLSSFNRTPVILGSGRSSDGQSRATIYFNVSEVPHHILTRRVPGIGELMGFALGQDGGAGPRQVDSVSYDFGGPREGITRRKLYSWIDPDRLSAWCEPQATQPDILLARSVFTRFWGEAPGRNSSRTLLLQVSAGKRQSCLRKTLFACGPWGWTDATNLANLVAYLAVECGMDLRALSVFVGVFAAYAIRLRPSFVAIGPDSEPSVTFYFNPECELVEAGPCRHSFTNHHPHCSEHAACVQQMIARGLDFITENQQDRHWSDFDLMEPCPLPLSCASGASDEWATAYVGSVVAQASTARNSVSAPATWLQERFRDGAGWGWNRQAAPDGESTALALVTLQSAIPSVPPDLRRALLRYEPPHHAYSAEAHGIPACEQASQAVEVSAVVLLANIRMGSAADNILNQSLLDILAHQRDDGAWSAFFWKDDLFATYRALHAVRAYIGAASLQSAHKQANLRDRCSEAIDVAQDFLNAFVLPDEPFPLALWLGCWALVGGTMRHNAVGRALAGLLRQQQSNGRWLSTPIRRIARSPGIQRPGHRRLGRFYLDPACLITTSTIIEALLTLRPIVVADRP